MKRTLLALVLGAACTLTQAAGLAPRSVTMGVSAVVLPYCVELTDQSMRYAGQFQSGVLCPAGSRLHETWANALTIRVSPGTGESPSQLVKIERASGAEANAYYIPGWQP